jgi:hypothetical protein
MFGFFAIYYNVFNIVLRSCGCAVTFMQLCGCKVTRLAKPSELAKPA